MLATEEQATPAGDENEGLQAQQQARPEPHHEHHPAFQESWRQNERMRHIPSISWMMQKLEGDLRPRIDKLFAVYQALPANDPRHAGLEHEFRALCRAVDRVAEVARRPRGNNHPPADLVHRISWSVSHAVTNLKEADNDTFGRRFPFHTFERSNAEPLWAAMLSVIDHVQRIIPRVREIDPQIDERLYDGLVVLNTPLRREPIA